MIIANFLNKENNNLDLIRIILASMVILGHTSAINGITSYWIDPIVYFFSFTYSGAIAVKLFFFISGLVVTNSYLNKKSLVYFIIARGFRILPALFFLLIVTVFVVGPIFTNLSLSNYFLGLNRYEYIWHNMIFKTELTLPGLFTGNLYNHSINGSLWTLRNEVKCYFVLLCILYIIGTSRRLILNIIIVSIFIDTFFFIGITSRIFGTNPEVYFLPFSFAYGTFFAINSKNIKINGLIVIISFVIFFISIGTNYQELLMIIAFCNLVVFISSMKFILKLKPKYDISYGIYLWGFLVQQIIYFIFGQMYAGLHFILALIISIVMALISFVYIEKPFIDLGRKTYKFCIYKLECFFSKSGVTIKNL
jgi:peptidoglycan/LPS O-acetylase OafA/YrhL